MRQSIAANKTSYASHATAQAAAITRLLEKKKEVDAVSALERASALYLQRMEGLVDDLEIMADAGQVHGQVLEQWPRMFQILNLFLNARSYEQNDSGKAEGERLVRIPTEEIQRVATNIARD
ncbi:hypothetical protein M378DRAFT_158023 [Amanita muscaria Koide BX008]|uniref:DASH complex subunit DAD2 n=1 Tax=Amanita muscaria (strain Koide BX008) TaxID=946122 RepID=A0A0C2TNW8_AMAMK|nr:hypothetical protein M378DRAFT_158023 [Amanita muscaria Koide BX008]